ncbi:hypothetical protein OBBRIDRAFT_738153 [Obba rivulosa]|uniref:Uncharacterized protein n=1 Tax=Obba rivulosa TaxID=1052685 RepID=A0A8E2AQ80_9APHY|nr:hypothetical protein OBBRIDRAFT_738153 [Obba rivulosa]
MPALETMQQARPVLGHVNTMVDGLIASATVDDLRAIIRTTLATSSPETSAKFTAAARGHFEKMYMKGCLTSDRLFDVSSGGKWTPTPQLNRLLACVRSIYGAGMGFASLRILAEIIEATSGTRWEDDSEMEDVLTEIDGDVTQAIQSSKEQMEGGRVENVTAARETVERLRTALRNSKEDVASWGEMYPFEKAAASVQYWKF